MKFYKLLLPLSILFFTAFYTHAQQAVEVIKFGKLNKIIQDSSEDVKVINFWATWCKPCVKELPYFEKITTRYDENKVKVILVSFDFLEELESKVLPFINKRNIKSEVKLLDETDYNAFIDKIDPSWSGAIPATLIVNNKTGTKTFIEKEFEEGELEEIIKDQLNN